MLKKFLPSMLLSTCMIIAAMVVSLNDAHAQAPRSIVPYPRDVMVETVDAFTKAPKNAFCIGVNAIDVKLTNSGYRRYVSVINRDTRGMERTLYVGWIEAGASYLSQLINAQLDVTGPAGTEMLRADTSDGNQNTPGRWVSFYVQNCGGGPYPPYPPYPPPYEQASVWASVYPNAIPQGGKGVITLQTTVESGANGTYYFEISNSWNQLWKRFPVSKRPYEQYWVTLPVGKTTKLGALTYSVKVWLESGVVGDRREVAATSFSFYVVAPGSVVTPYAPQDYSGYQNYPASPEAGWYPPYNGAPSYGMPDAGGMPYLMAPYDMSSYGVNAYPMGSSGSSPSERAIE